MSDTPPKVRIAPNSKESEMMVLGCMLTNVNALNVAADALADTDFYYSEHQIIFQVLKEAYRADKPADIHLVAEELKRQEKLDAIGGLGYITTLAQYAGTSAYIEEYAEIVQNKSVLRRMITSAQEIEKVALGDPSDVHTALDDAQAKFFAISQSANPSTGITIKDILSGARAESKLPYLKELQERQEHFHEHGDEGTEITGIPTDFIDLDSMINGLGPSNLIIVAGRPAMGKTAFAINVAENVCFKRRIPVGIFSLEMSAEQLLHRIICSQAQVESQKILSGSLSGVEYQRVVGAVNMMQNHSMLIDDQPGLRITDLRARARRMKESHNIGLLIIDYLQLLSGSGSRSSAESRQNEISEISRSLKHLARELNVPVICASQLSRKVEERTGHRPMMSDLRESGCLTGDTLITDANTGEQVAIKELCDSKRSIEVFGVNGEWKVGKHTLTKAFYSGEKEVFELKTRSGRCIKASANHPFLTINGWTPLENLELKESIAISRSTLPSPSDLDWDEIISITPLGVQPVYDATVENVHNFLANDIFVHNSIEQDSDVVMFLLRREYYDPYDKPGMGEIIVGKNRHGPVGSVNVTYRKELAQFSNYTEMATTDSDNNEAFAAFSPD